MFEAINWYDTEMGLECFGIISKNNNKIEFVEKVMSANGHRIDTHPWVKYLVEDGVVYNSFGNPIDGKMEVTKTSNHYISLGKTHSMVAAQRLIDHNLNDTDCPVHQRSKIYAS